jgi:imidazolonepropionase-like amidohydrolase
MKSAKLILLLGFLAVRAFAQDKPVTIRAGTLLDGKGQVLHNVEIVLQSGKIVSAQPATSAPDTTSTYDLRDFTVLPGWIDVHVHITWHFGPNGRLEDKAETPAEATFAEAGNAWATLMAGFTTIQSLGAPEDKDLRSAIARGEIPGPRIPRLRPTRFATRSRSSRRTARMW